MNSRAVDLRWSCAGLALCVIMLTAVGDERISESSILERAKELKSKDEAVARLESVIEEKSASIALLESEIAAIQKKGAVNAEELVGGAHVRVEKPKDVVKTQNKKRTALEMRANEAEEKLKELNLKLETIHGAWLPPWFTTHISYCLDLAATHWNERAKPALDAFLQKAYEKSSQAQNQVEPHVVTAKTIHGAWLPPWFTTHISYCQDLAATHWNERAKPAFDAFFQKAYEKSSQAQNWVGPHVKWIPAAKEQIVIFIGSLEPHFHLVSTKTIEFYEASKSASAPLIAKVQELTAPYFQIHGAWLPPWFTTHISYCLDLAATHWNERAKPAFDAFLQKAYAKSSEAQIWVEPHVVTAKTKWIPAAKEQIVIFIASLKSHFHLVSTKNIEFYEASKSASAPHMAKVQKLTVPYFQVQATVMEKLKNHELTNSLATKEFVWFVASALLAFPILFLYRLLSSLFCKKKGNQPGMPMQTMHLVSTSAGMPTSSVAFNR